MKRPVTSCLVPGLFYSLAWYIKFSILLSTVSTNIGVDPAHYISCCNRVVAYLAVLMTAL